MAPTLCPICKCALPDEGDRQGRVCPQCSALVNIETTELDYTNGHGQEQPSIAKSKWRRINGERRLAIIAPFLAGHSAFIDIGCGSGETVLAAKARFPMAIGYEVNKPLVAFGREQLGVDIENGMFSADRLPDALRGQRKVFASSHVIEHLDDPAALLGEIAAACEPGDLVYLEVPLYTGESFRRLGYRWQLWNSEHRMLFSLPSLQRLAESAGFRPLLAGTRVFARGSHSGSTRWRLLRQHPQDFIRTCLTKRDALSIADIMIADYGFVVLTL